MNILGKCLVFIVELFGWFLAVLPDSIFLVIVKLFGWFMFAFDNTHRYQDAKRNLDFIYGDKLSNAQKKKIIKRCYRNFAFVILQSARVSKIPYYKHAKDFVIENEHYFTKCLEEQGSAVLISGHFGYWEAIATFLPPRYSGIQMASLGRLTGIESIDSLIISRRELQGVKFVNKNGALRHLLKLYQNNKAVAGILVDQNMGLDKPNDSVVVKFMGKKATHTIVASMLSRKFGIGIVPVFIDFNEDYSKFIVRFYEPIFCEKTQDAKQDILKATQETANVTQKAIESNISSWFWFHRRWKEFYRDLYK